MFNDKFLAYILEVSFTHSLEPVSNILLDEFLFVLCKRRE